MFEFIKNIFNSKQKIIFSVLITFLVISIIIGITLLVVGIDNYSNFVTQSKAMFENQTSDNGNLPDITAFIYGIFFLVMSLLLAIASALYGNSLFNKKLNFEEN